MMPGETQLTAQDEMRLVELNEEYIEAFMDADVIGYQEHLADDFACIESDGFVLVRHRNAMTETSS
jgi:hypothetical protein